MEAGELLRPVLPPDAFPPINCVLNVERDTATVRQQDVQPTTGFANMTTTPYAWAKAFPTLFIPMWTTIDKKLGWHITHNVMAWHKLRHVDVFFNEWVKHMVWNSNGSFASHPTIALLVYNIKVKNQVNKVGRYVLSMSEIEASTLVSEIKNAPNHEAFRNSLDRVIEKAQVHSGNVPGTPEYWKHTYFELRAVNFYYSYMDELDMSAFHTVYSTQSLKNTST